MLLDNNDSSRLVIAFHGWGQVPEGAWLKYLDFSRMTGLREWGRRNHVSIAMPAAPPQGCFRRRDWSVHTDQFACDQIATAVVKTGAEQWYAYGFSDGADQALRIGLVCHGVVYHSGAGEAGEGGERLTQLLAGKLVADGKPLILVSSEGDRTPTGRRTRELHEAVEGSEHILMPHDTRRQFGRRLRHSWTPETNPAVWDLLQA